MVRADEAEGQLGEFLKGLSLPTDWQERIMGILQPQTGDNADIERSESSTKALLGRLKRLYLLGDLTETEYLAERNRLQTQLVALVPPCMLDLRRAASILHDFGTVWEGATFRFAGHIMPTLDSHVAVTVTAPSGAQHHVDGQANQIGYHYDPDGDFAVTEPGLWSVDVHVWHDGQCSGGSTIPPYPSGDVLGSDGGRY